MDVMRSRATFPPFRLASLPKKQILLMLSAGSIIYSSHHSAHSVILQCHVCDTDKHNEFDLSIPSPCEVMEERYWPQSLH